MWLERDGQEGSTIGKPADYSDPALSHDEKRVAVVIKDPQTQLADIWVIDIERGTSTPLTFDPEDDTKPLWSADDRTIYFTSRRSGQGDVYSKSSSGTCSDELVYGSEGWDVLRGISPDGVTGWVVSTDTRGRTGLDIYRVDLESRQAEAILQTPFMEINPEISPDGRWLLYQTNESGRGEVYVQSLLDDGGKWQISTDGGTRPKWTREGREIVFQARDRTLMAVEVRLEPAFSPGVPTLLFHPRTREIFGRQYDVTSDGNRFLVNQPIDQPGVEPLTLVQNWTSELER